MTRRLAVALLLALSACAGDAEIPAVQIGAGGARLMNGSARTPLEAYENAHGSLHRQHYDVRRNLEGRSANVYAARESMAALVRSLETMRALAAPSDQPRFDPYLARYRGWHRDLQRNFWGGSFLNDFQHSEIDVKSKLSPANVEIVAEFASASPAPAPAPAPSTSAPAPDPRPSESVPPDKAVVPTVPPTAPKAGPAAGAAPPGDDARLYYKAWNQAHDDLVAAYKAKKDCRPLYADVVGALTRLKMHAPPAQADKLEVYLRYYAGIHDKTKAFTALPEGEQITEKDILDELDVAARVLRGKEFNPDR